ncbi:MAG TPA: helix-turn-helix domain-containing protein [Solirubrobacteraceae bacterium]|jgi:transcriptional regulator GlxA family with amidase domain
MRAKAANSRRIALVVYDGLAMFEFGVVCEVFGIDRGDERSASRYELVVCGARASVTTDLGLRMQVPERLTALRTADTIIVPPCEQLERLPAAVLSALREAHSRGTRLVALCTGAFVLAAAGLLDGRRATTHWSECDELRARHPTIDVDPSVLYIDEGDILTSAGSTASIDLCLHLVALDHGTEVANQLARRLVIAPHREGGQAQYIETPLPTHPDDLFAETIAWAQGHLDRPVSIEQLASRAAMSKRTFARRFTATAGTTPYQWLLTQRLRRAQRLLEATDLPVELVAQQSGFSDATTLRKHFARHLHTNPTAYRRSFHPLAAAR